MLFATSAGTEMLALAFFEIFLAFLIKGKVSGYYLSLAILSRYQFLTFIPMLILNKNYKKIIKNIIVFSIVISPWLLFNYIKFGNLFTSVIDSYANNIYFRDYLMQEFSFTPIIRAIGLFTPFFIMGAIYSLIYLFKSEKKFSKSNLIILLFIFLFFIIVLDFSKIPLRENRYLFNLSLPIAFFSTYGIISITNKFEIKRALKIFFMIVFVLTILLLLYKVNTQKNNDAVFYNAARDIENLGLNNCQIMTRQWVIMQYLTGTGYPIKNATALQEIEQDKIVLIFKNLKTIDDDPQEALPKSLVLYKTDEYLFFAKQNLSQENCAPKYPYAEPYTTKHCEVLAAKFKKLKLDERILTFCNNVKNTR